MAKKVFGNCPVCGQKLMVSRLSCDSCNIDITGKFELNKFTYLEKEQLEFVETFLRCQGSLKDVQTELGISYPTAKKQLDGVLEALGYTQISEKTNENIDILARVESGELTAKQAAELIKKNKSK
jgi:hypothetical protein